ncbi:hydroxyacid dehydrogenase [Vibrio mytili]|uniref:Hydroxyacid dehydrogenase n=1 Tax=Vibrio mytili TaxID=50718 RepID=A0A0C3EA71_9VIBR|nr:hydroxyacid dehydrogenase [Vibrio mytili]KIN11323.1 hydroxyacid dehydrogenase [Vibrio mytili]
MQKTIIITGPGLASSATELLQQQGFTLVHTAPYSQEDELLALVEQHQPVGIISRMGKITARVIDAALPYLKVIAKHGVGVDNIDIKAAAERNIPVVVASGANAVSVAEHTIALMLTVTKQVVPLDDGLRCGRWEKPGFSGYEVANKNLGLLGMGSIAQETARIAKGLNMNLFGYDPYADDALFEQFSVQRCATVNELLSHSQILSLHSPLTDETHQIINQESIAKMPVGSFIINTARGGLIDEQALVAAIESKHLAGAGLDTFAVEPPADDHPFFQQKNIIVTPHIAGVTNEGSTRVSESAAQGIQTIVAGEKLPAYRVINRKLMASPQEFVNSGE